MFHSSTPHLSVAVTTRLRLLALLAPLALCSCSSEGGSSGSGYQGEEPPSVIFTSVDGVRYEFQDSAVVLASEDRNELQVSVAASKGREIWGIIVPLAVPDFLLGSGIVDFTNYRSPTGLISVSYLTDIQRPETTVLAESGTITYAIEGGRLTGAVDADLREASGTFEASVRLSCQAYASSLGFELQPGDCVTRSSGEEECVGRNGPAMLSDDFGESAFCGRFQPLVRAP